MYSKLIHPTDLSEASIPALKAAHQLAGKLKAKLIVCFVASPPLIASGNSLTDPNSNTKRELLEELNSHQPADPAVDRELQIMVTEKSTRVKKVLQYMEEMGCDLLVMGMHRRGGVAGWLGSSITEEVVREAHCAVLVVK